MENTNTGNNTDNNPDKDNANSNSNSNSNNNTNNNNTTTSDVTDELDESERAAHQLYTETNRVLEEAEATASQQQTEVDEALLEDCLCKFKECVHLDADCVDARFGVAYVCGHLDLYDEGLAELAILESMEDVDQTRVNEMKANLLQMKVAAEQEEDEEEEELHVAEGPLVSVDILINNGEITPQFQSVLIQIFTRFDKDKDGALNQRELDAFHRVVNGTPITPPTLHFLLTHFDVNHKGALTQNGFIAFYISQTVGDAEETWRDLSQLGYNRQLQLITQ